MKLSCFMPRGLYGLAAISLAFCQVSSAVAQFAPHGNAYQGQAYQNRQPHQAFPPGYAPYTRVNYNGVQPTAPGRPMGYAQNFASPPVYYPQSNYPQPQYVAMAQQSEVNNVPPIPQPMETVAPGTVQPNTNYAPQPAPVDYSHGGYESYSNSPVTGHHANGGGYGCDGYGNYNCPPSYGTCDVGYTCCAPCAPRRHWFGGVYGLLMQRVTCDYVHLAFRTPEPPPGYYPEDDEIVMTSKNFDDDFMGGAEIRFGATFACCGGPGGYGGCYDPCATPGCCGTLGWEAAYWALGEDISSIYYTDMPATRTYGMHSYQGLEFYHGGVWRPVNHAYDYAPPTEDHYTAWGGIDIYVRSFEARRTFNMQNVELNLVCVPLAGGGCQPTCDPCGGGCCDSYGGGCCGGGSGCHGGGGCGHHRFGGRCGAYCYTGPRCQCSTFLGARYLRFDESFMFRSNFERWNRTTDMPVDTGMLSHYVETDNHLIGFQVGGNGCYHLGCCGRLALTFGSNAGIYGNYIEKNEFWGGQVRFANGDQDIYNIMAEDNNVAFLGELRLGASYQCTCNCRVYGGYRALGVAGVALSTAQLEAPYMTPVQSNYVDCSGSIFLHGLQTGVEFMY